MTKVLTCVFGFLLGVSALGAGLYPHGPVVQNPWSDSVNAAGNNLVGLGDVNVGGSLSFSDTVWEDLTLSSLQFRDPPGAESAPALVAYVTGGVTNYVLDFDTGERSYGILQMSHGYKQDSEVRPHIHWTSGASVTSTWTLGMAYGRIGGQMTNAYRSTITVTNLTAHKHNMSNFAPCTDMTNKLGESGIFLVTLKCDDSGGDGQDLIVYDFDIHYQIDKVGSDEENPYE